MTITARGEAITACLWPLLQLVAITASPWPSQHLRGHHVLWPSQPVAVTAACGHHGIISTVRGHQDSAHAALGFVGSEIRSCITAAE